MTNRNYQPAFSGGELSPALYARVDLAKYRIGAKTMLNMFVHPHGGASNRAGFEYVCEVEDSANEARLIPFEFNTEQTYQLEFGDQTMRVLKDGAQVLQSSTQKTITGITKANPGVITATSHSYSNGNEIYIASVGGMVELNARNFKVANVTTNTFTLVDMWGNAVDTTNYTTFTSGGTATKIFQIATPYSDDEVFDLGYVQDADVMYITHENYAPRKLSRLAEDNWTLSTFGLGPTISAPTGVNATSPVASASTFSYRYVVSAISAENGEESLPSAEDTTANNLTIAGNINRVTWNAVTGASRYLIYRFDAGVLGYVGSTDGLLFEDENITPDLSDTPQSTRNPFNSTGDYPRITTFFEQRLAFGSTINNPQAVWLSQSANPENFNVSSPAKANEAITFQLRARKVNEVRVLVPSKTLLMLTSGAEWTVRGDSDSGYLTQNVVLRPQSYFGAARLEPIVVGSILLFAQARNAIIRDFSYDFAEDSFIGNDLTILARHIFEGKSIKSWSYAQAPYSMVWVILNDGTCASLTYMREHEVWAWTRHETDGVFEDVSVIAEGEEDVPYFIIRRTINGASKRYVERLHTRMMEDITDAFFVDSGLTYQGSAATVISGLEHLEGKAVVALADGAVVTGLTVTDGAITLQNAAEKVHVGLAYTATLETLGVDYGEIRGIGTVQGRYKSCNKVVLRVEDSVAPKVGPDTSRLTEAKMRSGSSPTGVIPLFTGDLDVNIDGGWKRGGSISVQQDKPLPLTVNAFMPEWSIGG